MQYNYTHRIYRDSSDKHCMMHAVHCRTARTTYLHRMSYVVRIYWYVYSQNLYIFRGYSSLLSPIDVYYILCIYTHCTIQRGSRHMIKSIYQTIYCVYIYTYCTLQRGCRYMNKHISNTKE